MVITFIENRMISDNAEPTYLRLKQNGAILVKPSVLNQKRLAGFTTRVQPSESSHLLGAPP
jgi:hypothetical protein